LLIIDKMIFCLKKKRFQRNVNHTLNS